jgi:hypothetical protein
MLAKERRLFELFKSTLNIHDPFSPSNQVRYSWNNKKEGVNRTLARLDRIYSAKEFGLNATPADYYVLADSALSDHLPMRRKALLEEEAQHKSPYVMNSCYLKEKTVKEMIQREWAAHQSLPFFNKLRRCVSV